MKSWRTETRALRAGLERTDHGETSEAMYLNSGYAYASAEQADSLFANPGTGFVYSRYGNPSVAGFERRLAALEGAEACFATASGMSAVFAALMCQLQAGQRVVAAKALFSSCAYILTHLLPRYGVEVVMVSGTDLSAWETALSQPTDLVFFETPANPTLELIDIVAVSTLAKAAGARVIVDNVFATITGQSPLELGADVVIYSATKHMDGQGRILGGAILGSEEFIRTQLLDFVRHTGPCLSPFSAWTLTKALETLPLRVEKMTANAARLADFLADHPAVRLLLYPHHASFPQLALARAQMRHGSTLIAFDLAAGTQDAAFKVLNKLATIDISNNLGDARSLITHPATTTHRSLSAEDRAELGIGAGFLRLSVGLEHIDDLIEDLDQALGAA